MGTRHFIGARCSPETKARFRRLAEHQQMTESGLLKRLVDSAVRSVGEIDADALKSSGRRLRGARTNVRLHPDDKLTARAGGVAADGSSDVYIGSCTGPSAKPLSAAQGRVVGAQAVGRGVGPTRSRSIGERRRS
jgi:hypothetical protein